MEQHEPSRKLVLKFNAHPGTTLERVVGHSNSLGLFIESIDDVKKTKSISIKVVSVTGENASLRKFEEILARLPAATIKKM